MNWIEDYAPKGGVAVDVGANEGSYTKRMLPAVGPTGRVIAIEPHTPVLAQLKKTGATVIHAAVADKPGTLTLYHSRQSVHSSLWPENVLEAAGDEPVRVVTLDELQASGEIPAKVDLIKVDAQGAEAAIMRGAAALIASQQAVWYVELWPSGLLHAGETVMGVLGPFQAAGYQPHRGTWASVYRDAERQVGHGSTDVLLLPERMTKHVVA